jgi:hypothetical protein
MSGWRVVRLPKACRGVVVVKAGKFGEGRRGLGKVELARASQPV